MEKILDFKKSVYELNSLYPDVSDILFELGFKDIVKPGMLKTAGRIMTIPKGAAMKKLDLEEVKKAFIKKGFFIKE